MKNEVYCIEKTSTIKDEERAAWQEYRCPNCNKLFFWGRLNCIIIEIKCRCCKSITKIKI